MALPILTYEPQSGSLPLRNAHRYSTPNPPTPYISVSILLPFGPCSLREQIPSGQNDTFYLEWVVGFSAEKDWWGPIYYGSALPRKALLRAFPSRDHIHLSSHCQIQITVSWPCETPLQDNFIHNHWPLSSVFILHSLLLFGSLIPGLEPLSHP